MRTFPKASALAATSGAAFRCLQQCSDICIVGNGIIGKVAALALAQSGLSITILGPLEEPPPPPEGWDPRVYALNADAQALLSRTGVWAALDATRVHPIEQMIVKGDAYHNPGKLILDAFAAHVDALAWIVEDKNLNQALDSALKSNPEIRVVKGRATRLITDDMAATIQLDNGDIVGGLLVVGADGAQSWVRGQCQIGTSFRSYGQHALVANFECEKPHQGHAHQWFTAKEGIVALLPLPGSRVSLVWSAPEKRADELLAAPLSQLAERLTALTSEHLGTLRPLEPEGHCKAFPLSLIRTHSMIAPRVALIGDAAHVIHPLAGQGMNLGFGDITTLMQAIAEYRVKTDCGITPVLSRYARLRKKDVLLMQWATDSLARLFASEIGPLPFARNLGLNILNTFPIIKRQMIVHALGKSR